MSKYDLTVVLPGKLTPAKKKSSLEKIEKIVDSFKGKIEKVDDWGRIDLMYPIEKNDSGIFVLHNIELNPAGVKKLNDKLKEEEDIIRYLLIKK